MKLKTHGLLSWIAFLVTSCAATMAAAKSETLRIVTYNIEDDIGTFSGTNGIPRPGLIQPTNGSTYSGTTSDGGVLEGIGELPMGATSNVQPLDILALQETTSNSLTVAPIVSALNTYYSSPGMYAQSSVQGSQEGGSTNVGFGNGPNAIVYNTKTLQLVASVGVGTPSASSGEYRQVMRYEFAPAGVTATAANEFYVYVSHYKSGDGATNQAKRQGEATIIRNNSATLPSTARILYVGDYNINGSSEASYQTIVGAGTNQGVDPLNPTNANIDWSTSTTNTALLQAKSESATSLSSRDDLQIMTNNVYSGTSGGLKLIANTYQTFGNNGTTPYHSSTNISGNTALNGVVTDGGTFISASQLKLDLTQASDHLPVVGDYALDYLGTCTWVGGGVNGNWSLAANWDATPTDGDSLIFAGTSQTSTTNNSLTTVGSITFNSGAGAFSLFGNALTVSGGIVNNSSNTQTIGLNLSLGAAQSFNAATGALTVNGSIDNNGNLLTVPGGFATTLGGNISDTGGLLKSSTGTLTLSGSNGYSGGTTVSGGTVQLGNNSGLGSSTGALTITSGTLDLHGFSPTIGALSGSGTINNTALGAVTLTAGNGNAAGSYSGTIQNSSGTLGLIKTGSANLTLSGSNSYSGGTTVSGGTLQLGNTNALGSSSGALTVNSGTLDLHGFSATVGALNGSGGTINTVVASSISLTAGNGNASGSYAGQIQNTSGSLALIKTGSGAQTLTGNNTYSGGTTVSGGTLVVGHYHALGNGGLAVTNSATTQIASGMGTVVLPSLSINGGSSTPTATLDIGANSVVIPYSGASPFSTIQAQIQYATHNLAFDRPGITSSAADGFTTAVGYAEASELFIDGGGTYVNNQSPNQSGTNTVIANQAVILKYTWLGDTDLNGEVDQTDFNNELNFLGTTSGADWNMGDNDGNGTVDQADFNNLLSNLGASGLAGGSAPGPVPVPEPSTLLLAALGLAGVAVTQIRRRMSGA